MLGIIMTPQERSNKILTDASRFAGLYHDDILDAISGEVEGSIDNWTVHRFNNTDGDKSDCDVIDVSNDEYIKKHIVENACSIADVIAGPNNTILIRVKNNDGTLTDDFVKYSKILDRLDNYPSLDDERVSHIEFERFGENFHTVLSDIGRRYEIGQLFENKDFLERFESELFEIQRDKHEYSHMLENKTGKGAYPEESDVVGLITHFNYVDFIELMKEFNIDPSKYTEKQYIEDGLKFMAIEYAAESRVTENQVNDTMVEVISAHFKSINEWPSTNRIVDYIDFMNQTEFEAMLAKQNKELNYKNVVDVFHTINIKDLG
jgi:hypothetical protein